MRAGGVSLIGIIVPVLVGGILISGLGFVNNEMIMPVYTARAAFIGMWKWRKKQQRVIFQPAPLWLRGPDNSIANIDLVTPDGKEMIGVQHLQAEPRFQCPRADQGRAGRLGGHRLEAPGEPEVRHRDDAIISQKAERRSVTTSWTGPRTWG